MKLIATFSAMAGMILVVAFAIAHSVAMHEAGFVQLVFVVDEDR